MMMHTFNYREYEPQEYPSADPLPALTGPKAVAQEREWLTMQAHPIKETIDFFQVSFEKYPARYSLPDPLEHLFLVAYGAHPLFGAWAARRASCLIRLSHGACHEFDVLTLASDTFARYAFTLGEAAECADLAAECAQLAGKPADVIAAWRARAAQIHAHVVRGQVGTSNGDTGTRPFPS
jgi:hypothetical protein